MEIERDDSEPNAYTLADKGDWYLAAQQMRAGDRYPAEWLSQEELTASLELDGLALKPANGEALVVRRAA